MCTLVHYTGIQSNDSLIVQNSDLSKNFSFSMISPVQITVGGKVIKKAMFAVFIIYDWVKKNNQQRQIYICIQMIDLRSDWLQRCTNCITHTATNFRNSKWQVPFLDFWKKKNLISLRSNQLQSSLKIELIDTLNFHFTGKKGISKSDLIPIQNKSE